MVSYTYDPFGRRIQKSIDGIITNYIHDGDQIIAEYDSSGTLTKKFIYGPGIDEPIKGLSPQGTVPEWYYHFDGLGSVTEITDSSANIVEKYTYDIYGNAIIKDSNNNVLSQSAIGNRYMFTGREYDQETGLYYYRARYYDPKIGRFLQADPIGYEGGINLYAYCSNNPTTYIDPMGLKKKKKQKGILRLKGKGKIKKGFLAGDYKIDFETEISGKKAGGKLGGKSFKGSNDYAEWDIKASVYSAVTVDEGVTGNAGSFPDGNAP